jgi:hypothetical protein
MPTNESACLFLLIANNLVPVHKFSVLNIKFKYKAREVIKIKGLTNELKAEAKLLLLICGKIVLTMLYKEEED